MQTFLYGTSWTPGLFLSKLVYSYRTKAGFQISLFQTFPYESIVNHTISVYRNQTDENNTFILSHPYKTIEHCDKTVKLLWLFYRSVLAVLAKTAKTELCDFVVCDCFRLVSILRACTKYSWGKVVAASGSACTQADFTFLRHCVTSIVSLWMYRVTKIWTKWLTKIYIRSFRFGTTSYSNIETPI